MGMFDWYVPKPVPSCPKCGSAFADWQGKGGACDLFEWVQGHADPEPNAASRSSLLRASRMRQLGSLSNLQYIRLAKTAVSGGMQPASVKTRHGHSRICISTRSITVFPKVGDPLLQTPENLHDHWLVSATLDRLPDLEKRPIRIAAAWPFEEADVIIRDSDNGFAYPLR